MSKEIIPFQTIQWDEIPKTRHNGESGTASWQTLQFAGLRIRLVEYSAGYMADHWCRKGHIVHCLEGEFTSELESGASFKLAKGMSYVVTDNASSHKSVSKKGVKLLIIDGDFLSPGTQQPS
jgi:quercetin dioxygenase-like cupin family protein